MSRQKLRGVSWHKNHNRYRAKIYAGRNVYLGDFDDPEEAALVYDAAERIVRGPNAILNFPQEPESLTHVARAIARLKAAGVYT